MPEGDTIFKLASYLQRELSGRELVAGSIRGRSELVLAGLHLGEVYPHGKHLFIELDQDRLLRSHLGVRGSWHGYAPGEAWQKPAGQAAIVLDIGERLFVCFNPLQVEVLPSRGLRHRQLMASLGPDLIDDTLDLALLVQRARQLAAVDSPIADVLLDQRIACGIGNVYKSEVLFLAGCHPAVQLGQVSDETLTSLCRQANELLRFNLRGGPRITRSANDDAGELWVYRRNDHPCLRCGSAIQSMRLGIKQRSTYWCPSCQPAPVPHLEHR